jgi:hypothetical protein
MSNSIRYNSHIIDTAFFKPKQVSWTASRADNLYLLITFSIPHLRPQTILLCSFSFYLVVQTFLDMGAVFGVGTHSQLQREQQLVPCFHGLGWGFYGPGPTRRFG